MCLIDRLGIVWCMNCVTSVFLYHGSAHIKTNQFLHLLTTWETDKKLVYVDTAHLHHASVAREMRTCPKGCHLTV